MNPQLIAFWQDIREELRRDYGQDSGRRDPEKARRRERFASELGLNGRTLKGFLNENQKTLGSEALMKLLAKLPSFEQRYKQATGQPNGVSAAESARVDDIQIQLAFQFDDARDPPATLTARLPQGRQGVLTVVIGPSRVA